MFRYFVYTYIHSSITLFTLRKRRTDKPMLEYWSFLHSGTRYVRSSVVLLIWPKSRQGVTHSLALRLNLSFQPNSNPTDPNHTNHNPAVQISVVWTCPATELNYAMTSLLSHQCISIAAVRYSATVVYFWLLGQTVVITRIYESYTIHLNKGTGYSLCIEKLTAFQLQ